MLSQLTTLLTLALPLLSQPALAATTCNSSPSLCNKLYSGVTFIGAHNSYAVGSTLADNQQKDVLGQLADGVRTLQVQAHDANGTINVCHQSCSLRNGGTLQSYLSTLSTWVSKNPNEVITLVIVNFDNLLVTRFSAAFDAASMSQYAYSPASGGGIALSAWPTLGSMIDSGKRMVVFMDNGANYGQVPWIIDEFSSMFEDAFNVVDQSFGCASNRTSGSPGSQLMLVNHFLDSVYTLGGTTFWVPNTAKLNETNAESGYGSIGAHVDNCRSIWGRAPNHILLDYYNSNGLSPFQIAASLNGMNAPTNTVASMNPSALATGAAAAAVSASGSGRTAPSGGVTTSRLSKAGAGFTLPSFSLVGLTGLVMLGLVEGVMRVVL